MDWNFIIFTIVKIVVALDAPAHHRGLRGFGGTQNFGMDSGPRRAESRCPAVHQIYSRARHHADPLGHLPAAGRRLEVHAQGRFHAGATCAKPISGWRRPIAIIPSILVIAVIPFGSYHRPSKNGHRGFERGHSLHFRHRFAGRLWDCAGGLRGQFKISVLRRHPFERADDFVRNLDGHDRHPRLSHRGQFEFEPDHRLADTARLADSLRAAVVHYFPRRQFCGNQPDAVRFAGSGNRNWSAATTRNTAR